VFLKSEGGLYVGGSLYLWAICMIFKSRGRKIKVERKQNVIDCFLNCNLTNASSTFWKLWLCFDSALSSTALVLKYLRTCPTLLGALRLGKEIRFCCSRPWNSIAIALYE